MKAQIELVLFYLTTILLFYSALELGWAWAFPNNIYLFVYYKTYKQEKITILVTQSS
jgi:hypothetical protein